MAGTVIRNAGAYHSDYYAQSRLYNTVDYQANYKKLLNEGQLLRLNATAAKHQQFSRKNNNH